MRYHPRIRGVHIRSFGERRQWGSGGLDTEKIETVAEQTTTSDQQPTPRKRPQTWYLFVPLGAALLCAVTIAITVHLNDAWGATFGAGSDWPAISWAIVSAVPALTVIATVQDIAEKLWGRRHDLVALRSTTLPERAKHASEVLREATKLVQELQSALDERTDLLEEISRKVTEETERTSDVEKLSHIDEETKQLFNKYFDDAVRQHLETFERK